MSKQILNLFFPIMLSQIGLFAMILIDTYMVKGLGANSLAAMGLSTTLFFTIFPLGSGILLAIDSMVAKDLGRLNPSQALSWFSQSIFLAILIFLFSTAILLAISHNLSFLPLSSAVIVETQKYLKPLAFCLLPYYLFFCIRQFLTALGSVRFASLIIVGSVFVNSALDWVLINGKLGLPAFGIAGVGWAAMLTRSLMLLMISLYAVVKIKKYFNLLQFKLERPNTAMIKELLRIGLPIGGKSLLRSSFFVILSFWIGSVSAEALAAHTIVQNIGSFLFMIPFSLTMALATIMAQAFGQQNQLKMHHLYRNALGIGLSIGIALALLILIFAQGLLGIFSPSPSVYSLSLQLMPLLAAIQIIDGVFACAIGALRGVQLNKPSLKATLYGLWLAGLSSIFLLSRFQRIDARAIWYGIALGLFVSCVYLTQVWLKLNKSANTMALKA